MYQGLTVRGQQLSTAPSAGGMSAVPAAPGTLTPAASISSWAVSYGQIPTETVGEDIDLLIVEAGSIPDLAALRVDYPTTTILAYVSVAELSIHHPLYPEVEGKDYVIGPNPNWPAMRMDIRSKKWRKKLRKKIIQPLLDEGYDGIMMDGFEVPLWLEDYVDSTEYAGSKQAMIDFTNKLYDKRKNKHRKAAKKKKPKYIAINGGWTLGGDYPNADFFLIESVFNGYNFATGDYEPVRSDDEQNLIVDFVQDVALPTGLVALGLDYAADNETVVRQDTCSNLESVGFLPYVATIDLQNLDTDPCREQAVDPNAIAASTTPLP